jgi:tRNA G18 (ribose-2'-O)-methylase SpoU
VLVLFGIANHDNMGGLLRNAAAFGADAVLLDGRCCDPLYRKAIRVSVGAALTAPFARLAEGEDALALLAGADFTALALSPSGAERVTDVARPDRVAVLLGAEGPGLPAGVLAGARTVAIPMAGGWDSLNVAAASAIVLHQLAEAAASSPATRSPSPAGQDNISHGEAALRFSSPIGGGGPRCGGGGSTPRVSLRRR